MSICEMCVIFSFFFRCCWLLYYVVDWLAEEFFDFRHDLAFTVIRAYARELSTQYGNNRVLIKQIKSTFFFFVFCDSEFVAAARRIEKSRTTRKKGKSIKSFLISASARMCCDTFTDVRRSACTRQLLSHQLSGEKVEDCPAKLVFFFVFWLQIFPRFPQHKIIISFSVGRRFTTKISLHRTILTSRRQLARWFHVQNNPNEIFHNVHL